MEDPIIDNQTKVETDECTLYYYIMPKFDITVEELLNKYNFILTPKVILKTAI